MSKIHPLQDTLFAMGPVAGKRYRRKGTGTIAVVLRVEQRRHSWVWIRMHGTEQMLTVNGFMDSFELIK